MNLKFQIVARIILIFLILFSISLSFKTQEYPEKLIWSDMEGYYTYLPSVFIYNDFVKEAVKDTTYIKPHPVTGKIYTKYTCGVAMLEMPFFLATHLYAKITHQLANGKNAVYGRGLAWAGLFYLWMALFILYSYCINYFHKKNVLIALGGLVLGTNLFYYSFFQPAMSHVYSFFLFSAFIYMTDKLINNSKPQQNQLLFWVLFGLTFGLICLVRPTNIIVILIPFYLWYKTTQDKMFWLKNNYYYILAAISMVFLISIPQLLFWKYITGSYLTYSYGHESFKYWMEPKLLRVLFDPWNGWILYSPIVILPFMFLIKGRYSNQYFERIYLYIFILATYIFASWWAWWFGGAFGHRSFVEYLALLALPFAGLLQSVQDSKWKYYSLILFMALLCYYNLGLTYAYNAPWDGESWTYQSVITEVKKIFFIQ